VVCGHSHDISAQAKWVFRWASTRDTKILTFGAVNDRCVGYAGTTASWFVLPIFLEHLAYIYDFMLIICCPLTLSRMPKTAKEVAAAAPGAHKPLAPHSTRSPWVRRQAKEGRFFDTCLTEWVLP
jgi:hypothetical protein